MEISQFPSLNYLHFHEMLRSAQLASVGELAFHMAHELNNSLTTILGFTSFVIRATSEDDVRRGDLRMIEAEVLRARETVGRFLSFARQRESERREVAVNEVIESILPVVRHQAEISNIAIKEEYADGGMMIRADADQIRQVLVHIITNAFDAMPDGGEMRLETRCVSGNGEGGSGGGSHLPMVEIGISDTGIGISPEDIQRIFDPFFTTKREKGGTGLGLAASYVIIKKHNGRIDVVSEVGKGSSFRILLPCTGLRGERSGQDG